MELDSAVLAHIRGLAYSKIKVKKEIQYLLWKQKHAVQIVWLIFIGMVAEGLFVIQVIQVRIF
jgi:hypothetical protein